MHVVGGDAQRRARPGIHYAMIARAFASVGGGLPDVHRADRVGGVPRKPRLIEPLQAGRQYADRRQPLDAAIGSDVEIRLNRNHSVRTPSIPAGGRLQVPLDTFVAGFGQRFDYRRMPITDLRLHSEAARRHAARAEERVRGGRPRRRPGRETLMARLKSELEVACPCCHTVLVIDTNLGRVDLAQGAGARQQARAERRAEDSRRRSGAARSDLPAVGRLGEEPGGRAVEAVRRGAASGQGGTGHQADARLRSRLTHCSDCAHRAFSLRRARASGVATRSPATIACPGRRRKFRPAGRR